MTCFIATADAVFKKELESLCRLANVTVTDCRAELLLLDLDMPIEAPNCAETLCFSHNSDQNADFIRPFSYGAFWEALVACEEKLHSEQHVFSYEFPEDTAFTTTEKRLLDALFAADGNEVSSKALALHVFGNEDSINELKVYIRHLRKKIEEPQGVRVIETVRGVGYRLRKDRISRIKRES